MIRGTAFVLALAAVAATGVSAKPVAPAIYGDVKYIEEAGDLVGMELELFKSGSNPHVDFVLCEGECSELFSEPVHLTRDGFRFHYFQRWQRYVDGKPRTVQTVRMDVAAHPIGKRLRVTVTPCGKGEGVYSEILTRRSKRYALAIAKRS